MDMNAIREYICSDNEIKNLIGNNVFLFEKPEKVNATDYIIYNFKEINGGSRVRDYQLDIRVISKDKLKLLHIKDVVIDILDNFNKDTDIRDIETIIRHTRLINGGGIIKDEEKGEYNAFLYFLVKI